MTEVDFKEYDLSKTPLADIKTDLDALLAGGWSITSVIQRSSFLIIFVLTQ